MLFTCSYPWSHLKSWLSSHFLTSSPTTLSRARYALATLTSKTPSMFLSQDVCSQCLLFLKDHFPRCLQHLFFYFIHVCVQMSPPQRILPWTLCLRHSLSLSALKPTLLALWLRLTTPWHSVTYSLVDYCLSPLLECKLQRSEMCHSPFYFERLLPGLSETLNKYCRHYSCPLSRRRTWGWMKFTDLPRGGESWIQTPVCLQSWSSYPLCWTASFNTPYGPGLGFIISRIGRYTLFVEWISNNSVYLLGIYYVSDTPLYVLSHLIRVHRRWHYYYLQFADDQTEAQKGWSHTSVRSELDFRVWDEALFSSPLSSVSQPFFHYHLIKKLF